MPSRAGTAPWKPNILVEPPLANSAPGPELSGFPVEGDLSEPVRSPATCSPNMGVFPPLANSTSCDVSLWVTLAAVFISPTLPLSFLPDFEPEPDETLDPPLDCLLAIEILPRLCLPGR